MTLARGNEKINPVQKLAQKTAQIIYSQYQLTPVGGDSSISNYL